MLREGTFRAPPAVMNATLRLLVPCSVLVLACAACSGSPPATPVETKATSNVEVTTAPQVPCDLVCEKAQIVSRVTDAPDYNARATANANQVIGDMHGDLLACYKARVAANPDAHAFLTIDVLVGPDGRVQTVETTGGALLGPATMTCLTSRIQRGVFEPPHGGGTLRIHVPFSLRRVPLDQST